MQERLPNRDAFSSYSELIGSLSYRREAGSWRCHILTADDELRCAIPATLKTVKGFGINFQTLNLGLDYSSQPLGDYSSPEDIGNLVDSLFKESPKTAFLNFPKLDFESTTLIASSLATRGYRCLAIPNGAKYYFDTTKPVTELTARMPKSFRRTFTRQRQRMEKEWTVTFAAIRSTDLDSNLKLFDEFQHLEKSGWKGDIGSSLSDEENLKSYFEFMIRNWAPNGEMLWYKLAADGKPIAMYMCSCVGNTVWAHKTAYAAEYSSYSPGNDLLLRILEQATDNAEIAVLNMVTGPEWLKKWRPDETPLISLKVFATGFRGTILYWLMQLKARIKRRSD